MLLCYPLDNPVEPTHRVYYVDLTTESGYSATYARFWFGRDAALTYDYAVGTEQKSDPAIRHHLRSDRKGKVLPLIPTPIVPNPGGNRSEDQAWFLQEDGTVRKSFHFVLVVSFSRQPLSSPPPDKSRMCNLITVHQGKEVRHTQEDRVIAVFTSAVQVTECALAIHRELSGSTKSTEADFPHSFRISIAGDQSDVSHETNIPETIRLGQRLSMIAENQQIVSAGEFVKLDGFTRRHWKTQLIRVITSGEEQFLTRLFDVTESHLEDGDFNVEGLGRYLGISRPQLYRKVLSITGSSPGAFIKNLRMKKAFALLKNKEYTISEIAWEVGINNPSYFSKCFRETYGMNPSEALPEASPESAPVHYSEPDCREMDVLCQLA